jgi:hypothetical protein
MGRKLIKAERASQEDDDGTEKKKTKRSQFLTLSSYFLQREIFRELSSARRQYVSFIHVIEKRIKLRYFLFITPTTLSSSSFTISS